ncbi:hypothetical protein HDU76_005663 [Blyttiomyces sp. JEL0837]|nr:hypothetical protein HDU76_005663 [Blyttiomyces sp. JEL0837]
MIEDTLIAIYNSSPRGLQLFFNDVAPYMDVVLWSLIMIPLITRFSEPGKPRWIRFSIAMVTFIISLAIMAYQFSLISLFQLRNHRIELATQGIDPDAPDSPAFLLKVPLDLMFQWTPTNMTDFYTSSGLQGAKNFYNYLTMDCIAIVSYSIIHTELLNYLYPAEDPMSFLTSRIGYIMAGLDIYENWGHLYMSRFVYTHPEVLPKEFVVLSQKERDELVAKREAEQATGSASDDDDDEDFDDATISTRKDKEQPYLAERDFKVGITPRYFTRIVSANATKFGVFFVLLGLELSGFVKLFAGTVQKEVDTSGVSLLANKEQKKAEEKRKARLAAKKKE